MILLFRLHYDEASLAVFMFTEPLRYTWIPNIISLYLQCMRMNSLGPIWRHMVLKSIGIDLSPIWYHDDTRIDEYIPVNSCSKFKYSQVRIALEIVTCIIAKILFWPQCMEITDTRLWMSNYTHWDYMGQIALPYPSCLYTELSSSHLIPQLELLLYVNSKVRAFNTLPVY